MSRNYIEDKQFEKTDFSGQSPAKGDYDNCTFSNCNFAESNLAEISFTECTFTDCNLSNAKFSKTGLRDVKFNNSKLLGLHFDNCDPFLFEVSFEKCILNLSSFYQVKMKKTNFTDCILQEVDFTGADLSQSVFTRCDLAHAIFGGTLLEKADLSTAFNYSIDPASNTIKKAKFSFPGIAGLLNKYDIEIE